MNIKLLILKIKKLFNKIIFDNAENILLYVCGNEALPLPLSEEDEKILIDEMANDNKIAREKLIEHNLRLVVYIAKKFENTNVSLEDLISIGAIGLIKAVKTYKYDKKIKLATYASRCIENEILMHLRKTTKQKIEVSLEQPLNEDGDGNELLLTDILTNEEDTVANCLDQSVEKELLWRSIKKLDKREQDIMILRFGLSGQDELTQKEVADLMGISQSYISRIEKKILGKIKKELEKVSNL